MPTYNSKLGDEILEQIHANPKLWVQHTWRYRTTCGTAYCFAGWAAKLTGNTDHRDNLLPGLFGWFTVGKTELGLTESRASVMFHESRTLPELIGLHRHFTFYPDDDSIPELEFE